MADGLAVDGLAIDVVTGSARGAGSARVVDDVSFVVHEGRATALVGESGSGKTLTALSLLRLLPDAATVVAGRVVVDGDDLLTLSGPALRQVRGKKVAMVFQEPMLALNPLMRVDDQAGEALRVHQQLSKKAARAAATTLLERMGLPAARASAYPHELSGGQRQRVMLASALSASPRFLIADEPTTALDVTVQAQILRLLREEQQARGLGLLLITHDLGVVAEACDDVVVMYAGKVVEQGAVKDVFAQPRHPYMQALLAAMPSLATPGQPLPQIPGQVPPAGQWPQGCRFRDRCARADAACEVDPPVVVVGASRVRCVHAA